MDACQNLWVKKIGIYSLKNVGCLGNDKLAGNYNKSHDEAKREGYHGSDTVGLSFSSCTKTELSKFNVIDINSKDGDAIGIQNIFSTESLISKGNIEDIKAGKLIRGEWKGEDYYGNLVEYSGKKPNYIPSSIGILIDKGCKTSVFKTSIQDLKSCGKEEKILRK